jgi:anti-sigma-K factor RskA
MNPLPIIDPEFKGLIQPLSADERQQLEHNITTEGECREAIILWGKIIVDWHNRYEICTRHGIEFGIREMEFESRDAAKIWILNEQLGRRNLHEAARIEIVLKKAESCK